ncbi:MAG: NfeD family protein [Planctomycetaceae bacterium]
MSDYSSLAILLLLVGLAFIIMEVFIPSGGMITILSVLAIVASIWCAAKAWWYTDPWMWWAYIASVVLLIPCCIGGAFFLLPRTALGRKFLLEAPSREEVTPYLAEQERLRQMVGKHGTTLTLLNPGGLVLVERERMHSESDGMRLLEPDEDVVVVAVKGNRLVVRAADAESKPIEPPFVSDSEVADERPLDFDVPQS